MDKFFGQEKKLISFEEKDGTAKKIKPKSLGLS